MSIELHCPQCGKLIRAPDDAGGRRGKCPNCKNSVYIPMPPAPEEEIKLAPIDPEEERREQEARREATRYAASVDHTAEASAGGVGKDTPTTSDAGELTDHVEVFLRAMHGSKLDDADAAATRLKSAGPAARKHVEGLLADADPPPIEGIPPPLVLGFLKQLRGRL